MLYFFILSHFIGDYLFQTDKLFYYKSHYKWGIFLHATIVGAIPFFVFMPLLHYKNIVIALIINWISHIIIDYTKSLFSSYTMKKWLSSLFYIIDQIFHIGVIIILYNIFFNGISMIFYDKYTIYAALLSFMIWVSFGVFFLMIIIFEDNRNYRMSFKYRLMDMVERLIIFTLFIMGWKGCVLGIIFLIYRYFVRKREKVWFISSSIGAIISSVIFILIGGTL